MRRSPCPRGVASETGGAGGWSPGKAFSANETSTTGRRSSALFERSRKQPEKRGGIGDKREGGVPTAPPRRECGAKSKSFKQPVFKTATVH